MPSGSESKRKNAVYISASVRSQTGYERIHQLIRYIDALGLDGYVRGGVTDTAFFTELQMSDALIVIPPILPKSTGYRKTVPLGLVQYRDVISAETRDMIILVVTNISDDIYVTPIESFSHSPEQNEQHDWGRLMLRTNSTMTLDHTLMSYNLIDNVIDHSSMKMLDFKEHPMTTSEATKSVLSTTAVNRKLLLVVKKKKK